MICGAKLNKVATIARSGHEWHGRDHRRLLQSARSVGAAKPSSDGVDNTAERLGGPEIADVSPPSVDVKIIVTGAVPATTE